MASLHQYSEDYTQFFNVTATSQLQIWDTFSSENTHTFAEDKHLSRGYTAIAYASPNNESKGEDSSRAIQNFVALGTDKGSIVIWDVVTGQLLEKWDGKNKAHQKSVTGVVFGRSVLYSCSDDGNIIEWDVQTAKMNHTWVGEKQGGLASIAINPNRTVLATASTTIKVWDLSSLQVLVKLTGHTSPVSCMQFSVDGLYLLTSSTDRYINLWSTDPSREQKSPLRVFSCESTPKVLQWNRHQPTEDLVQYDFLSVLQSGVVNIWSINPKKQKKKGTPNGAIKIRGSQGGKATHLIFGDFTSENEILVTSDYLVNYESYRVQYTEEQDDLLVIKKETVLTRKLKSLLEPIQSRKEKKEANKEEGGEIQNENENENKRKREHVLGEVDMPFEKAAIEKRTKKLEFPEEIAEINEIDENTQNAENAGIAGIADVEVKPEPGVEVKPKPESQRAQKSSRWGLKGATSMLSALEMVIHTKNEIVFSKILNVINDASIQNTVASLSKEKVIPLIDILIIRLRYHPSQGHILMKWLKIVFEEHLTYLLDLPGVWTKLSPIYALIDSRVAMFKKISTVSGKLDLLLRQAREVRRLSVISKLQNKAQFIFQEQDVEEESDDESEDNEGNEENEENQQGQSDGFSYGKEEFDGDDEEMLNGGEEGGEEREEEETSDEDDDE